MAVLESTYDLRAPGRSYEQLYKAIKGYGKWAKPLESIWIIQTTQGTAEVAQYLWQFMDANDGLLVARWQGEAAWYGVPQDASEWMKNAA